MSQISARLPSDLVERLDEVSHRLGRTRTQVLRQAVEYYLEDVEDLRLSLEALQDPADPILDWDDVRRELLDQDQG